MESQADAAIGASNVIKEFLRVLAHDRFLVITSNVVPRYTVVVYIVEYAKARFRCAVNIELCIVRLALLLVPCLRPWVVAPTRKDLEKNIFCIPYLIISF